MTTAIAKPSSGRASGSIEPKARRDRKVSVETYAELLAKVKEILLEGRARAKRLLEHEEVRTWWEAARAINVHLRSHRGRAAYGERTVALLSCNLRVTKVYLYDILRFQRAFRIINSSLQLTLSHYRILSRIEDTKGRTRLYRKAVRDKLTVPELLREIRSRRLLGMEQLKLEDLTGGDGRRLQVAPTPAKKRLRRLPPLKPRRGRFYTYRVVKAESLHTGPGFYSIDLGFGSRHDLKKFPGIRSPKVGEILEAVRTRKDPRGDWYRFRRLGPETRRLRELLYTYKAFVTLVRDDDTLWADIDQGFHSSHERKLRFRGIDAPEIGKGKQASDYVKRVLARVPFVVISATGRDKFGRPLTDLFYLEGTKDKEKVLLEGKYLNQELLDLSLAKRV